MKVQKNPAEKTTQTSNIPSCQSKLVGNYASPTVGIGPPWI